MATLEQIEKALRAADAAGNVEDARRLAQAYKQARDQQQPRADFSGVTASVSSTERVTSAPGAAKVEQPAARQSLFRADSDFRERSGAGPIDMLWAAAKDMFGSREGAATYLAGQVGGKVATDARGEPVVQLQDGTQYLLNDPGVDSTDVANVAGNVAAMWTPAAWASRINQARGAGLAGRALTQGGVAAATDAGLQAAFNGGEIDPVRTATVAVGGAGGEIVGAGLGAAANRARSAIDPVRQRAVEVARQQGIPLHLSQVSESVPVKAAASAAKYLPLSGAGKAAKNQQAAFNRAVARTFGANADQLTDDVVTGARRNLSGQFEDIYSRNNVPVGEQGLRRLTGVESEVGKRLTKDEAGVVRNQMDSILAELDDMGALSGQKYQALRSQIMKAEGPDKVGQAVAELRKALDDIAAKAVGPEDAATLQRLRGQWANLRTTESMLKQVAGAGGDVKPSAIWPAIRKGSTKEMRDLGRLGQTLLKNPIPDSGTPGRLLGLTFLGGGGVIGGASALPTLGGLLAGGATVGRGLNSSTLANLLLRGQETAPTGLMALARAAPASGLAVAPVVREKKRGDRRNDRE